MNKNLELLSLIKPFIISKIGPNQALLMRNQTDIIFQFTIFKLFLMH